ncbi:MAG: Ig-like domain-containing protein, partial [Gemmatimonadota bacterium]
WGCDDSSVSVPEPPPPRSGVFVISVAPAAATARIGDTLRFRATVLHRDSLVFWDISRPDVARIDPVTGLTTALAAGTTSIVATARADNNFKAAAQLTVVP